MHYRRMPIEVESPEELGYGTFANNLAERSAVAADAAPEPSHAARRPDRRSARGLVYGNRGCLHDATGRDPPQPRRAALVRVPAALPRLAPRAAAAARRFTELFFLDDATAFAAGHRPCALCRRTDYDRFLELWGAIRGADAIDERLHAERLAGRAGHRHAAAAADLPDGAFIMRDDARRGSCAATRCCAGRRRATPSGSRGRAVTSRC